MNSSFSVRMVPYLKIHYFATTDFLAVFARLRVCINVELNDYGFLKIVEINETLV